MEGKHGAGKGDTYRKVDQVAWERNWNAIFGEAKADRKSTKRKPRTRTVKRPRNP